MEFFIGNALMGFGLLAGAAPVVIHLLNRQRFKRVRWAAMHFLWAAKKKSNRILTLKELLLLILRILILLFLALALMRMILGGAASLISGRTKIYRVIVLDNSYSMDLADGNTTLFERGRSLARKAINELHEGDECSLVLMSDVAQPVMASNSTDLKEVLHQVDEARLRPTGTNAIRAMALAHQLIRNNKSANPRTEILIITDGTARAWKSSDTEMQPLAEVEKQQIITMADPTKGGVRPVLVVFNLRPAALKATDVPYNLSVENVSIDDPLPAVGSTVNVRVDVRNRGQDLCRRLAVTLFSDGKKYERQEVENVEPGVGKDRLVQFRYLVPVGASHTLRAVLQDPDNSRAGSSLAYDDQRYYSFDTIEKVNVLMVDGDKSHFLLQSDLGLYNVLLDPPHVAGQINKIYNITHISDLEFGDIRVEGYDAIIMANVGLISPKKRVVLDRYIREGGAVLIFPGSKTELKLLNEQLGSPASADSEAAQNIDILPATLLAREGNEKTKDRTFQLAEIKDSEHPMLLPLKNSRGIDLSRIHIYRRVTVQMPTNNPACDVVLKYSDGQPALVERRIGRGRVMLMTTTANTDWNDMIPSSDGAILCHTMMGFLIQGTGAPRNLKPGDSISIDLKQDEIATTRQAPPVARLVTEEFSQQEAYEVPLTLRIGKGKTEVAPATPGTGVATPPATPPVTPPATGVPISNTPPPAGSDDEGSDVPTLISTPLDRVGAYAIKIKGQEAEGASKERDVFVSLNPVTDESDLRGISNVELQEIWRQALYGSRELPASAEEKKTHAELDVRNADESPSSKSELLQASGSLELRWLFLAIMLPALLLESFLAMYFGDYEGRFNQIMSHMWGNVTGFFK